MARLRELSPSTTETALALLGKVSLWVGGVATGIGFLGMLIALTPGPILIFSAGLGCLFSAPLWFFCAEVLLRLRQADHRASANDAEPEPEPEPRRPRSAAGAHRAFR